MIKEGDKIIVETKLLGNLEGVVTGIVETCSNPHGYAVYADFNGMRGYHLNPKCITVKDAK